MTDHPGRLWKGRQAGVRPRRGRGEAFSGVLLERGEKWAGLGEEEGNREGSHFQGKEIIRCLPRMMVGSCGSQLKAGGGAPRAVGSGTGWAGQREVAGGGGTDEDSRAAGGAPQPRVVHGAGFDSRV